MITVQITTSVQILTFTIDIPLTDTIELHYDRQCKYCDTDIRTDAIRRNQREFCNKPSHRVAYCEKGLALVTANR